MEDAKHPEVRDVRRTVGGRGLCGGAGKIVERVFPGRSQSFRHQRRPVNDGSPRREGMAQNGRTMGGIFDGENMQCVPERGAKDQGEDSPKQAGSCWFTRQC